MFPLIFRQVNNWNKSGVLVLSITLGCTRVCFDSRRRFHRHRLWGIVSFPHLNCIWLKTSQEVAFMLLLHLCFHSHTPLDWQDKREKFSTFLCQLCCNNRLVFYTGTSPICGWWVDGLIMKESYLSVTLVCSVHFCSPFIQFIIWVFSRHTLVVCSPSLFPGSVLCV